MPPSPSPSPSTPTDTADPASAAGVTTTITAKTEFTLPPRAQLNPRSRPTEFLGPAGAAAVTVLTPLTAYALFYACNEVSGCSAQGAPAALARWAEALSAGGAGFPSAAGQLFEWKALGVYCAWYAWCVLCWAVLPQEWIEGGLLRDGTRKKYKMNGLWTLLLTLGIAVGVLLQPGGAGIEAFTWIYDHWVPLLTASLIMSTAQAAWVYVWSFFSGELLALGGNSGVFIYDFWIGRPLNPTFPGWSSFDIKTFNEVRPGLIGWVILNISCACEQYVRLGHVTDSMWLVLAFEGWYVVDCMLAEPTILGQMDITTDGFGFMLSFGDLTWVPFTYSLQARFLAFSPVTLGWPTAAAITALEAAGLYIFRVANNEKAAFRSGRNPKNLSSMETARGTRLITSGWWGRSRHPNYFGDWLMAWAWCLPTGFSNPLTYFYVIYFAILLMHRQTRDDEACREKYGKDWDKYCSIVKYKIIPYVY